MSSQPQSPRRTPLTVKLAYGQIILAVAAFALVPIYAIRAAYFPESPSTSAQSGEISNEDEASASATVASTSNDPITRGEAIFSQNCAACHQATGQGIPGAFPPLAGSDYLLADSDRAIGVVLHGLVGPVTVNGVLYESAMPPMPLEDEDAAAVLSYVLQAWGNSGAAITPADVARVRAAANTGS